LSFPEHGSFNDFIDKELCIVKYSTIDDAIKMIHKLGKNTKLAKCDIKSAFVQQSYHLLKGPPILYKILEKLSEYCSIVWFQLSHQIKNHQGNVKYCHYLTPAERTNVKLLLLRLSPGDFDLMGLNLKISISSSNVYPWERTLVVHYSRNFNSFTLVRSAGVK
jgi:hypothetical protein